MTQKKVLPLEQKIKIKCLPAKRLIVMQFVPKKNSEEVRLFSLVFVG